jgi:hypothetical protein
MNAMTETDRREIRAQWTEAGEPTFFVDSRTFEGALGLDRLLNPDRHLSGTDVAEVRRQLARALDEKRRRDAGRVPVREPLDPSEESGLEAIDRHRNAAAIAEGRYRQSPEGRAERTIELLEEIREALTRAR